MKHSRRKQQIIPRESKAQHLQKLTPGRSKEQKTHLPLKTFKNQHGALNRVEASTTNPCTPTPHTTPSHLCIPTAPPHPYTPIHPPIVPQSQLPHPGTPTPSQPYTPTPSSKLNLSLLARHAPASLQPSLTNLPGTEFATQLVPAALWPCTRMSKKGATWLSCGHEPCPNTQNTHMRQPPRIASNHWDRSTNHEQHKHNIVDDGACAF